MRLALLFVFVAPLACVPCTNHAECADCVDVGCLWIEASDDAGSTSASCVDAAHRAAVEHEGWRAFDDCDGAALP